MLTIYAEDLVVRPVGELEEILTFSDIPLPERSLMFEYGARLKSEMASLLEADLEVRKKYHDVSLDKVLTRAYEDELEGTQMLSQYVIIYCLFCCFRSLFMHIICHVCIGGRADLFAVTQEGRKI